MKRSKLWSGLTSTSAALLVVGLIGQNLAAANASYINTALGTTTTKVVHLYGCSYGCSLQGRRHPEMGGRWFWHAF